MNGMNFYTTLSSNIAYSLIIFAVSALSNENYSWLCEEVNILVVIYLIHILANNFFSTLVVSMWKQAILSPPLRSFQSQNLSVTTQI